MIVSGAEVAALGRVLAQTAKAVAPTVAGAPANRVRRAETYSQFQQSALSILAWAESNGPLQQSASPGWPAALAAVSAVAPSIAARRNPHYQAIARAASPVSALLLAGQIAQLLDYQHAVRAQLPVISSLTARLLTALADVRMVGGLGPQKAAEETIAVIGELLASIPVVEDRFLRRTQPSTDRYVQVRDAVGHQLRHFGGEARTDLAMLWFRRRTRKRWWQLHRPRPIQIRSIDLDVEELIRCAAISDRPTESDTRA